jgi:predicted phage gp36 major capsid-like protein
VSGATPAVAKGAPLLSDEQMQDLYDEIFEEPVSAEVLLAMYSAASSRRNHEWVMDRRTWDRIRRLHSPNGNVVWHPPIDPGAEVTLLGLPVVIEPLAKLSLRVRRG